MSLSIPEHEIEITAIRAQGAGGQNVNKVSSAVHLRFDIQQSSLPPLYKERLLQLKDHRVNKDGIVIIKAQRYRSQDKNREDAIRRLESLVASIMVTLPPRIPTRPSRRSQQQRLESKAKHGALKALRNKLAE